MATVSQEETRSSLSLLRDVVLSLTRVVEDSTELIGASVHEELARFRTELARHALSVAAVMAGASLLTAGLAMLLSALLGSWPLTLVIFGAIYLGAGFALSRGLGPTEEET
jgi:hypothetical protein